MKDFFDIILNNKLRIYHIYKFLNEFEICNSKSYYSKKVLNQFDKIVNAFILIKQRL